MMKTSICKFCSHTVASNSAANHMRWCKSNPKREEYVRALNSRRSKTQTTDTKKKIAAGVKNAWRSGKYVNADHTSFLGKTHSNETKSLLREKALKSPHRRLRRNPIEYKGIILDSTWELALAQRLDETGVHWIRPDPVKWKDAENTEHHYFPDFYLPEFNLYLDPKNSAAQYIQKEKLLVLRKQLPNLIILSSLQECQTFVPVAQQDRAADF